MRYTFDTNAFMALFGMEEGAEKVRSMLQEVESGKASGYASVSTLTEIYYIYAASDPSLAQARSEQLLSSKLIFVPVDVELALRAGTYKKGGLSVADAFIAATAHRTNSPVVTDDPGFAKTGIEVLGFR
jgi:predicted nucleic acid-binding protein